jgi:hypothetical protein
MGTVEPYETGTEAQVQAGRVGLGLSAGSALRSDRAHLLSELSSTSSQRDPQLMHHLILMHDEAEQSSRLH